MRFTKEDAISIPEAMGIKYGIDVATKVFDACQKEIEEINGYRENCQIRFNEKVRELHIADGIISDQQKEIEKLKSQIDCAGRHLVKIIVENQERIDSIREELKSLAETCSSLRKEVRSRTGNKDVK